MVDMRACGGTALKPQSPEGHDVSHEPRLHDATRRDNMSSLDDMNRPDGATPLPGVAPEEGIYRRHDRDGKSRQC